MLPQVCALVRTLLFGITDRASPCSRLFPDARELLEDEEENSGELTVTNTEIASSLPLQMMLYFNVQYSVFWGLMTLALMVYKVSHSKH